MRPVFPVTRRVRRKRTARDPGPGTGLSRPRTSKRTVGPRRSGPPPGQRCDPAGPAAAVMPLLERAEPIRWDTDASRSPRQPRTPALVLVLVRGFVLRHDVGGNAPALIDLVTALLGPRPDLGTALAAGTGAGPAAPSRSACF